MKQGLVREDGFVYRGTAKGKAQWASPSAWHRSKINNTLFNIKNRIKSKATEFDLDVEYLMSIFPEDGLCPVFRFELVWNGDRKNSPSLDRIDPNKGYVKGNVEWVSDLANRMKNSANIEELLQFSNYCIQRYGVRH